MEDFANEKSTLLPPVHHHSSTSSKTSSVWTHKLKKRFSNVLVTSPVPILCLVWVWVESSIYFGSFNMIWSTYATLSGSECSLSSCNTYIPFLFIFLFPILGYFLEKHKRYFVLMVGVFIVTSSSIFVMVFVVIANTTSVLDTHWKIVDIILLVNFAILLLGNILFLYNSIQFTIDQLQEASSEQMATFTRWWVFVAFGVISNVFMIPIYLMDWIRELLILFALTMIFVFIGICFKPYFKIEPPPSVDPLKLIYRVLKYAWVHKYPVRRSAFTYNDNPTRLDYSKDRYGGPFTTDQVESVRSFWYILAVLLSSTLFAYFTTDVVIFDFYNTPLNALFHNDSAVHDTLIYYTDFSYLIMIGVPIIQFIVKPFFPSFKPSMLKLLWIGLFTMTVSYLSLAIIYNLVSDPVFIKVSIGLSIINNIGSAIIILVSLEFIVAQSPSNMRGILFGVYCLQFMVQTMLIAFSSLVSNHFIFLCIVTSLLIISFIAYNLSMYCYKYRVRNESSDVNRRQVVEEIYDRYLSSSIQDSEDDYNEDMY